MIIYAYTTETYKEKGWYKVGQTKNEALQRVKDQNKTSNPEEHILVKYWKVSDTVSDHDVFEHLSNRLRPDREWFKTSITKIDEAVKKAEEFTMSKDGFQRPNDIDKNKIILKLEEETGLKYLSRAECNDTNIQKSLGTAITRQHEGIETGFVFVWPNSYSQLSKIEKMRDRYQTIFEKNNIKLIFITRSDY